MTAATSVVCTGSDRYDSGEQVVLNDGENAAFSDLLDGEYVFTNFVDP